MGLPKFRAVKRCVFCPGRADSREHAWSDWALRRLPRKPIFGRVDDQDYHDPHQRQLRVRCVCEACNTSWMKGLEDAVIGTVGGMMDDTPKTLTLDEQRTIACWGTKTAMVFEHLSREKQIFYTDEERQALRVDGELPPDTAIWLARLDGRINFYARGNDGSSPDGLTAYVTTLGYGCLVIQIVTLRRAAYTGTTIRFANAGLWQNLAVRIWPRVLEPVRWPGKGSILEHGLDRFHERFGAGEQSIPARPSYSLTG